MIRSRGVHLTLTFAALAAAGLGQAGPAAATPPPDPTPAVVLGIGERTLPLPGVENARDVGGYATADGRVVRTGLVYRTANLSQASDLALAYLSDHGLKLDEDLRSVSEVALIPDRVPAGAVFRNADVIGQNPVPALSTFAASVELYRAFITTPGANEGFSQVLRDIIATPDGTVLFHCMSGNDRTGWTAAVLLTILGVDRATVYYDYLLSNFYHDAAPGDARHGVVPVALDSAFDQANQTYGSFDAYVHNGLRLTDGDIAALKAKMLS
ncbi:protein-tyrosine-phosphatase [Nocardia sp. ET3-3]|uniref:Protein-tyrosine-phosphatase n=1 Tax=Nocardia terrae TaxID=2675851 RepID=A0A7K1UT26_9NOCA|nr:tyrosine-protein phosphatase [Nocardia terrae]MVU77503.1 protein-tyrosine-phosphatase [Nocardia terrae]